MIWLGKFIFRLAIILIIIFYLRFHRLKQNAYYETVQFGSYDAERNSIYFLQKSIVYLKHFFNYVLCVLFCTNDAYCSKYLTHIIVIILLMYAFTIRHKLPSKHTKSTDIVSQSFKYCQPFSLRSSVNHATLTIYKLLMNLRLTSAKPYWK